MQGIVWYQFTTNNYNFRPKTFEGGSAPGNSKDIPTMVTKQLRAQ